MNTTQKLFSLIVCSSSFVTLCIVYALLDGAVFATVYMLL